MIFTGKFGHTLFGIAAKHSRCLVASDTLRRVLPAVAAKSMRLCARYINTSGVSCSDIRFTEQHEWIQVTGNTGTIGITRKAADALGELVYVELTEVGTQLQQGEECGSVESVKAVSELYAPVSGRVTETNAALSHSPNTVNKDPQGPQGWLLRVEMSRPADLDQLMDSTAYQRFLEES